MSEQSVIEATIATSRAWLHELVARLELPPEEAGRAMHALRAGLHAIRDRLTAPEVVQLGAQLPVLVRGIYYDGWRLTNEPSQIHSRAELLERVQRELEPDRRLSPPAVLSTVLGLLVKHVSAGEIANIVATLPRSIAELWKTRESR